MADRMAHATPKWTPGTICRYHPITYAWLLGEIAHRADGRSFQEILRQEVIEPLHLEHSLFFGTTPEAEERFVLIDLSAVPETHTWHTDFMHDPVIRRACIPSANGVANAESIARHYAALIAEVDGVRLLKPETVSFATRLRRAEDDPPRPGEWLRSWLGSERSGRGSRIAVRPWRSGRIGRVCGSPDSSCARPDAQPDSFLDAGDPVAGPDFGDSRTADPSLVRGNPGFSRVFLQFLFIE